MSMRIGHEEFGRGRRNDSSSSRESSPRQTKKRSFSPTSDDGDLVIPPIAYDDTPPPPDRPLLRQPVAFAWTSCASAAAAPAALNTYQVDIPPATEAGFLPGQKVALPPAAPPRKRKKKGNEPSKKRKKADYEGQTNRFRLQPYDPSSVAEPPVLHGSPVQPYAPASVESILPQGSLSTLRELSGTPTAASPSPTLPYSHGGATISQAPVAGLATAPTREPRVEGERFKWRVTDPPLQMPGGASPPPPGPAPGVPRGTQHNRDFRHYRRDYESDVTLREHESGHASTSHRPRRRSPSPGSSLPEATGTPTSRSQPQPASSSYTPRSHDTPRAEIRRPQKAPLLMLTLLIQDIRSGVTDHQLAEVRLPMKPANDPSEGFWADAKVLGQQLQSGASRIDGPARVYTMRGKYRQFFLRVTAENVDEFISTHLAIKPDRMLDVVVEALPQPGQLPLPPKIPQNLIRSPTPGSSSSQSPTPERETFYELPFERQRYQEKMMQDFEEFRRLQQSSGRAVSMSSDDSLQALKGGRKPQRASSKKRKRSAEQKFSSPEPIPAASTSAVLNSPGSSMPRFDSPDSNDSPDEVNRLVAEAVDQIIQDDDEAGWKEFFRARAALEPHRVMDVLKQYRFVKRMIDKWAGQRAPFRSFPINIEPSHITRALKIEEPNFASACVETLALLELYGPKGRHCEDSRVIEMINDTSKPEYNSKPIKRLLHLLRDIDKRWKEEHPPQ
ncbi:hypothetical protein LshimejAT787_0405710 [Lyophyllum shimeji]|uniref:Uncharacterized protein n=1 Tax=Lyophyllum shimeji TaxID=47721 RepID=A0A9P3PKE3_LYOSH|nr:hypothetical protein LshimejAT787_0405710 [Lyophyllum shimeji]